VVPRGYRLLRTFARPLSVLLRHVDAQVAVSNAVADSLRPYFPKLEFEVIANGVDTSFFSPDAQPLPHLAGRRNILFVGRFDPRNGLKHMLETFVALRRRGSDAQLVVLGDGPMRPLLKRLVPPELEADVRFEGRVNRLRPRYLASAEVFCTPCRLASFGMVVLEAMSSGTPIVATRLPGFAEVMRDGVHGLMIDEPDDIPGFVTALETLLDDPQRARTLGRAGRARVVTTFGWSQVGDALEELYTRLLATRTTPTLAVANRA
jgi:phosphatidylinositol alpha-mannosyltransferase